MSHRSFVEPDDFPEIGDEVVFHGDHGNLVRGRDCATPTDIAEPSSSP